MFQLLVHNPKAFENFSHVILDEIHERDMDSDLASLVVKLLAKENIKLIIMSATLQGDMFLRYKSYSFFRSDVFQWTLITKLCRNGREKTFRQGVTYLSILPSEWVNVVPIDGFCATV